uniref:C2H2-type domain-containing protein n=1 Tax=Mycena chlorophos TaxID=658473 RepID=A0ABQ0KVR3_MYCCL|nr:predicted protein [Mycena chlorophos]
MPHHLPPAMSHAMDCCSAAIQPDCGEECMLVECAGGSHCSIACEEECVDCGFDCHSLDDILQCCTDLHAYYDEPRHNPEFSTACAWDPNLNTFVCCAGGGAIHADPILEGDESTFFTGNSSPAVISTRSIQSPPPTMDLLSISTVSCEWGTCGAVFTDLPELVQHVNAVHLGTTLIPAAPTPEIVPTSCQWKDCDVYPMPSMIPGPSSGNMDSLLDVLSSHLLHDHLGLNSTPEHVHLPTPPREPAPKLEPSPEVLSPLPHAPTTTHTCDWLDCGESCESLDELTQHLSEIHVGSGRTSYECFWANCLRHGDKGFSSKQKLCRHLQSHTGHRPFQCNTCMQNFSEAATLQQHMRRHTQEKPYLCPEPGCGKAFSIVGALTIHKRTHNGDKPFKCEHCGKPFSESSNLSKHLRTHTGVKPYVCPEPGCKKSFARADQLTRHGRVHRKVSD